MRNVTVLSGQVAELTSA